MSAASKHEIADHIYMYIYIYAYTHTFFSPEMSGYVKRFKGVPINLSNLQTHACVCLCVYVCVCVCACSVCMRRVCAFVFLGVADY